MRDTGRARKRREETRVLAYVEKHGDVPDSDLPILKRLIDQGRVRETVYEDYVGYEVVIKRPTC